MKIPEELNLRVWNFLKLLVYKIDYNNKICFSFQLF